MSLNFKTYSIFSSTYPILTREKIESVYNQVEIVFDTIQELQAPDTGPVFDTRSENSSQNNTNSSGMERLTQEQLDLAVESLGILDVIREGFNWAEEWRGNQEALNAGIELGIDKIDKIVDIFLERLTTNPDYLIEGVLENSGIIWEGRDIEEQFGPIIEEFYGVTPDVYILSEQFSYDLMNSVIDTLSTSETLNMFDNLSAQAQQNYISQMTDLFAGIFLGSSTTQVPNVMIDIANNISSFVVNSYNSSNAGANTRYSNLLLDISSYAANINVSNSLLDVEMFNNVNTNIDVGNITNIVNNLSQVAGINNIDLGINSNLGNVNNLFNNLQLNGLANFNVATNNVVRLNSVSNVIRNVRVNNAYSTNNNITRFRG